MCITIQSTGLPHDERRASPGFGRNALGFGVRNDVRYGGMRGDTVGPFGRLDPSIVLNTRSQTHPAGDVHLMQDRVPAAPGLVRV